MGSLIYIPTKRFFHYRDDFFKEGNIALNAFWLEREATNDIDIHMIREEAQSLTKEYTSRPIFCELNSCIKKNHGEPIAFPNLLAYEAHYESQHRYSCQSCHKRFPGSHWLNLHFDECHNVLIQIQKEKGEKIYKCFIETCLKKFSTLKMRRLHLIDKHHYPKNFDFKLPFTGTISYEERQKQYHQKKKLNHYHEMKKQKGMEIEMKEPTTATTTNNNKQPIEDDHDDGININNDRHHDYHAIENENDEPVKSNESIDMEMDALIEGMSRIKIPSTISFGRGKKATWNRSQHRFSSSYSISKNKNEMEDVQQQK